MTGTTELGTGPTHGPGRPRKAARTSRVHSMCAGCTGRPGRLFDLEGDASRAKPARQVVVAVDLVAELGEAAAAALDADPHPAGSGAGDLDVVVARRHGEARVDLLIVVADGPDPEAHLDLFSDLHVDRLRRLDVVGRVLPLQVDSLDP